LDTRKEKRENNNKSNIYRRAKDVEKYNVGLSGAPLKLKKLLDQQNYLKIKIV
jgi:hypothetical protein